ncbi:MAG TPA: hypothetical protein VGI06_06265, partial [Acidimicrobiales bacterium]
LTAALVLLVYALVYDAAAWVVGTDARYAWIGPAAGSASILSATVAVAAITQFKGGDAWVLGGLAAVLAPLGAGAASLILGDRRSPVPALRRLDSLVLLGPVWAVTAARLGV